MATNSTIHAICAISLTIQNAANYQKWADRQGDRILLLKLLKLTFHGRVAGIFSVNFIGAGWGYGYRARQPHASFRLDCPPYAGSLTPHEIVPVLFRPAGDDQNLKVPSTGLLHRRGEAPCRRQNEAIRLQHVTPPTEI